MTVDVTAERTARWCDEMPAPDAWQIERSNPQTMTVRAVLAKPVVRRAEPEVVAGESGLLNEIRWVHAAEVSNIASMLTGGELLLSTGMGIGTGARAQRQFVEELAACRVAALAIELGTTMSEVPRPLVEAAQENGLCLIAFHREARFVEMTEVIHRELIDQGGELRRRGDELHNRFTALMLGGARVTDILVELADFVRNPVILERSNGEIAYHARHWSDDETVLGAWGTYRRNLIAAPEAISERIPMSRDQNWGRLVTLAVDSPLEPQDRIAVERAVGLIALAMLRESEEECLDTRRQSDFLASLPNSRASGREIAVRAAELGFTSRGDALLPLAMAFSSRPDESAQRSAPVALRTDLVDELERRAIPVIAGVGERGESLFVLGISRVADRRRLADLVAELAGRAAARRLGEERLTICVGGSCSGWPEVARALSAASEALPAATTIGRRPWHDVTIASTDRLLFSLRDQAAIEDFAELALRPLIDQDCRGRGELVSTLAAYCDHCGRKADTAAALGIKRQSLYGRLRRIEEALEADLDDGETRLALHVALKASRWLKPNE